MTSSDLRNRLPFDFDCSSKSPSGRSDWIGVSLLSSSSSGIKHLKGFSSTTNLLKTSDGVGSAICKDELRFGTKYISLFRRVRSISLRFHSLIHESILSFIGHIIFFGFLFIEKEFKFIFYK